MSSGEDPVAWLRRQVEARLAVAREASPETDGHWWRRLADTGHSDSGTMEPSGHLWAGEPVFDVDGDVVGGEYIVVYDEGRPSDAQFGHIAANDPRDTIARCEAELAILDELGAAKARKAGAPSPDAIPGLEGAAYLLASAYRHHAGYAEHWGGQG